MKRRVFSQLAVLTILLISTLTLAFNIQPAKGTWTGTVYIRADGSIDPPTAPIYRFGNFYILADDIYGEIVVERSNIIIDGVKHFVEGNETGKGFYLSGVVNVTVTNVVVKTFEYGIFINSSSVISISENTLINNTYNVEVFNSINNTIYKNKMTGSTTYPHWGANVYLENSSYNEVLNNTITNSKQFYAVVIIENSIYNTVSGNTIVDNLYHTHWGFGELILVTTNDNIITENNFTNNQCDYGIRLRNGYTGEYRNEVSYNTFTNNEFRYSAIELNDRDVVHWNTLVNNSGGGIDLWDAISCHVHGNIIFNNEYGIRLKRSTSNQIFTNNLTNNDVGLSLDNSGNNLLVGNKMFNNTVNFEVDGDEISDFIQSIATSNLINGKPVYYLVNHENMGVPSDAGYLALINCYNVTAEGLELENNGQGVLLVNTTNSQITGNTIANNKHGVVLSFSSNNNLVSKNIISYNNQGVYLKNSSNNNTVDSNNVTNNIDNGIYLFSSSNNNISGNKIAANNYGISLWNSSNNNIIVENRITANVVGIRYESCSGNNIIGNEIVDNGFGGISSKSSNNNTIASNRIANNPLGLHLFANRNSTLIENSVIANDVGIHLARSSYNSLVGNKIANNHNGISLFCSSNNSIYHNNFVYNIQQVDSRGSVNVWDDGYPSGGNYWSTYQGVDLFSGAYQNETGSDGIGDMPYIIDENNTDQYPLMKPYSSAPHDIGIVNLASSKTVIGQGYTLNITIIILNYGNNTENFNLTLYTNTTTLTTFTNIQIQNKTSTTLTFTWNTAGFAKGNYTISAYAWPVPGETDTVDNTYTDGVVYVSIAGDVNADGKVDMKDIGPICRAFGSYIGHPLYNPNYDVTNDGKIDMKDIGIACRNFGKTDP